MTGVFESIAIVVLFGVLLKWLLEVVKLDKLGEILWMVYVILAVVYVVFGKLLFH